MATRRIKRRKRNNARKSLIMLLSLVVVFGFAVGATYSYFTSTTPEVTNTMIPGKAEIEIDEDFDGTVKKDVKVTNTSDEDNVDVYIRVMLVSNWLTKDDAGNGQLAAKPSWTIPENVLNVGEGKDWFKGSDGYYYYKAIVGPGESTSNILDKITLEKDDTDDTYQSLEVLAEAIQAYGVTDEGIPAVEAAWEVVTIDSDKTLKAK